MVYPQDYYYTLSYFTTIVTFLKFQYRLGTFDTLLYARLLAIW